MSQSTIYNPKTPHAFGNQAAITYVPILRRQFPASDNCSWPIQKAEQLFSSFQQAATTSNKEVRDFTRLMKDEEGVKLFEHAKKSRAENPHGIKPWRVTEHPDWLDRDTWFSHHDNTLRHVQIGKCAIESRRTCGLLGRRAGLGISGTGRLAVLIAYGGKDKFRYPNNLERNAPTNSNGTLSLFYD